MTRNAIQKVEDGAPAWAEGLTDKQRRFCEEYIIDLDPTESAVRAGIGRSRKASTESASRLRKQPEVAAALARLMSEKSGVSGMSVVNELAAIAFAKVTDFVQVTGGKMAVVDSSKLSEAQKAAIAEISVSEDGRSIRVKLADKISALNSLGKALGLFKERVEHSGPQGGPIEMTDAKSRLLLLLGLPADAAQPMQPLVEIQPPLKRVAAPVRPQPRIIDGDTD
jgi:phage terminase small subunit